MHISRKKKEENTTILYTLMRVFVCVCVFLCMHLRRESEICVYVYA